MIYYRRAIVKATVLILINLLALLPHSTEAVPREILKSNRKVNTDKSQRDENTEVAKIAQIDSLITPIISLITSIPTTIIGIVGNLTSGATGGIGSLFNKGNSTGSSCNLIDPLLAANIPGIFIAVPLVILGIAILIGVIAAIVIAIGGLGGDITKSAYDMKYGNQETSGYQPSGMPMYGNPVSTYGSPSDTSSYSRLSANVNTATQGFNQAYDKYSALATQDAQSPSAVYSDTSNQYDGWNNNIVMKRMKS